MATRAAKATGFPNKAIAHCTPSTFSGHEGNVRDITSSGRLRMNITPSVARRLEPAFVVQ